MIFMLAAATGEAASAQVATANTFVPTVEFADSAGRCENRNAATVQPDERGVSLRFGTVDSASRVVVAVWDTSGHLRRYTDTRGDLRGPPVPISRREARTTITIDIVKGVALLENQAHGTSQGGSMITAAAALDAPRLGPPRELLARLHTQCGAPAP
jgi:hypothetical protein